MNVVDEYQKQERELIKLRVLLIHHPKYQAAFDAQILIARKALEEAREQFPAIYVSKRAADLYE